MAFNARLLRSLARGHGLVLVHKQILSRATKPRILRRWLANEARAIKNATQKPADNIQPPPSVLYRTFARFVNVPLSSFVFGSISILLAASYIALDKKYGRPNGVETPISMFFASLFRTSDARTREEGDLDGFSTFLAYDSILLPGRNTFNPKYFAMVLDILREKPQDLPLEGTETDVETLRASQNRKALFLSALDAAINMLVANGEYKRAFLEHGGVALLEDIAFTDPRPEVQMLALSGLAYVTPALQNVQQYLQLHQSLIHILERLSLRETLDLYLPLGTILLSFCRRSSALSLNSEEIISLRDAMYGLFQRNVPTIRQLATLGLDALHRNHPTVAIPKLPGLTATTLVDDPLFYFKFSAVTLLSIITTAIKSRIDHRRGIVTSSSRFSTLLTPLVATGLYLSFYWLFHTKGPLSLESGRFEPFKSYNAFARKYISPHISPESQWAPAMAAVAMSATTMGLVSRAAAIAPISPYIAVLPIGTRSSTPHLSKLRAIEFEQKLKSIHTSPAAQKTQGSKASGTQIATEAKPRDGQNPPGAANPAAQDDSKSPK